MLEAIHKLCENMPDGFSSMSQDVMNCRKTEIDAINGFVVDRARLHNVPVPYNSLVLNLVHAIENTYREQVRNTSKYAEEMLISMSRQISLSMKHIEMLNEELSRRLPSA